MGTIQFGTDGWRAIINQDFIPENISKVIQAFALFRKKEDPENNKILIGFDRRAQSHETAKLSAEILAGNGFEVFISSQYCPTPCVSWMVKNFKANAGVMITASHNPPQWNGIKFKESYGGSASPEYTNEVEKFLHNGTLDIQSIPFQEGLRTGAIKDFSPKNEYLTHLRRLVDIDNIKKSEFKILYDSLYGAGSSYFESLLKDAVEEMHSEADTNFGGLNPEPIAENLQELMSKMKTGQWDIGLATDGDADRIGAVDHEGNYINSHQIFALLLKHYVENKKLTGRVVKSISTTQMIDKLCSRYRLELIETPIGFKHICKKLVESDALMGGEESGGLSFAQHIHERDGVLNGLMLLELMAHRKMSIQSLIQELYQELGTFHYKRFDHHVKSSDVVRMKEKLSSETIDKVGPYKVVSTNFLDGYKYFLENDSWLLLRASGTEPLIRIYAEAPSIQDVERLIEEGKKIIL